MWARWRAISSRVLALREASELHALYLHSHNTDQFAVFKVIGSACWELLSDCETFAAAYASKLPREVVTAIQVFSERKKDLFKAARDDSAASRAAMMMMLALRSEVEFLLSDHQEEIRSRAERAFLHLQRVIASNPAEQAVWKQAFSNGGETRCEALGATHLLWHGIFAFKANSAGARTDLVFGEPLDVANNARAVDGIVLTEWKVASDRDALSKFAAARAQTDRYQETALAGVELTNTRYLIAVSLRDLPARLIPVDVEDDGILYRHINIVIEPSTPSRAARSR